jgi:mycothiol synthase
VLRAFADAEEHAWRALLETRGYEPVRHFFRMVASLDRVAAPVWPDGVVVRTLRHGEERAVHAAHGEAFADHWDFALEPYERWLRNVVDTDRFDRSLCFIAAAGDEIAGICLCAAHLSGDPALGWVRVLGVRPAWRRRGLGLALLLHAFQAFRRRGCGRVGLGVDAGSSTGALELYERAGMRVDRRHDVYERLRPVAA